MKRTKFLGLALISASLAICPAAALAQAPGGGGMAPSQGSQQSQQMGNNRMNGTTTTDPSMSKPSQVDDKKFLKDAALGGMTEVELGKLAAQKADSPDVKQFAQKMVDDHTKAGDQLKQVATQDNIQIPAALDSKHQARIDKLSKLSGPDFDKAYVKDQLKDHEMDARDFGAEAQSGKDPNVKAFASNTLPVIQQHLELVKNLSKSEKQTAKKTSTE